MCFHVSANNSIPRMDFSTDSYPAVLRRALYMVNDVRLVFLLK